MSTLKTALFAAASLTSPALSQPLSLSVEDWEITTAPNGEVRYGEFEGRDALYISRGQALRTDIAFSDVVIEYAVAATQASGFMGVNFRMSTEHMEQFYTRAHLSGKPDASQYQGIINGISAWQIHAGPNDAQAVPLTAGEWTPVKIVAIGDAAEIYVHDMETPLLHIADLRSPNDFGSFGLFMGDRPWIEGSGAWFSNVHVRAATAADRLVSGPRAEAPPGVGLIDMWSVSEPFEEDRLNASGFASPEVEGDWRPLAVEANGVANLAHLGGLEENRNTVLVRTRIHSSQATTRRLNFGYSDRVKLYLNGEEIYAGNAAWRSRDHRHLGTITDVDSVPLRLRPGENTLVAAVSENFGGWGVTARIEDQSGLTIEP